MASSPMVYRSQAVPLPPPAYSYPGYDPTQDPNNPAFTPPGGAALDPSQAAGGPPVATAGGGQGPIPLPGPQAPPVPSYNVPGATGNITNTTSPGEMTSQDRMYAATTGGDIMANIGGQMGYYGGLQEGYRGAADTAYTDLAKQPGYTPDQESQINVDYGKYATPTGQLNQRFLTPEEQAGIAGDPNAPANAMAQGTAAEGAMLNQYQTGVGDQLQSYQGDLSGQVGKYGTSVGGAVDTLGTGLDTAQGKFSALNTAVNRPDLAFDPNATEKELTDADVQQMKTAAGTRVGNQYRAAEDQLQSTAAAAGNTSPLAIAAANARLQAQEAADQGDAETAADIQAKAAQYQRAAGIEAQREGAVQTQAGMQAGAATTEEQAAQAAAGLAGTQGIAAAENVGAADINAANTYNQAALNQLANYGQFSTNTAADIASKNYGANLTAEQEAAQRAGTLATNRQGTTADVQNTQFGQGMQTAGATSQGAQTVGNAQIAGMNNYRGYLTDQQKQAQSGAQTAQGQQTDAFKATTQPMAEAAATQESNKAQPGLGMQIGGLVTSFLGGHAEGSTVIDKPTKTTLAERGPEMVIPLLPRYKSGMKEQVRKAA